LKKFVLTIALAKQDYEFIKKINLVTSIAQLKRILLSNQACNQFYFNQMKSYCEEADSLDEFEKILVYMNLLISEQNQDFIDFKSDLYWWVINQINNELKYQHYAILRHLKKFNRKQREELIENIWKLIGKTYYAYHSNCVEIYLTEKDYESVYKHLPYIKVSDNIDKYKINLKEYDSKLYKNYFREENHNFFNKISSVVQKIMLTCF
jgi:hypothetical protein